MLSTFFALFVYFLIGGITVRIGENLTGQDADTLHVIAFGVFWPFTVFFNLYILADDWLKERL